MKRFLIVLHRWLGVALCLLFLLWFPSGIGMMYFGYPAVTERDRLERAPALQASQVRLSPAEAYARLGFDGLPDGATLTTFDGRPIYRFRDGLVFADTGEIPGEVSTLMVRRMAAAWTGQPVQAATMERVQEVDQWTVQQNVAALQPLWKFSWPNGEQVYVSQLTGEVEQYTTTASRIGAYLGPIPHWFYFTPLRKHGPEWSRIVIWTSGMGTIAAILGLVIGAWMYSPSKRYRYDGAPSRLAYRGQKRWHMALGLVFGIATVTWAFSGMLSMDPFPRSSEGDAIGPAIEDALRGDVPVASFAVTHPCDVLEQLGDFAVKELELTAFAGDAVYLATGAGGDTRVVPLAGEPLRAFETDAIEDVVTRAAAPVRVETRIIDQYDRYYLDRRRERPLPVLVAELDDPRRTRYYIDPRTARVVETYDSSAWMNRWLYSGLHSLNFPWLYNNRPLWDIVVIAFMLGGTALSVTSLVLAWRVLGRALRGTRRVVDGRRPASDDLALAD